MPFRGVRSLRVRGYKRAGDVIRPERVSCQSANTRTQSRFMPPGTGHRTRFIPGPPFPRGEAMCDEAWEKELAKRWRLLAAEDEMKWLPVLDPEVADERIEPVVLPPPPAIEEKKRGPRVLLR